MGVHLPWCWKKKALARGWFQLPETLSYKAITCPTNPEDVNQFICCGRDNKAYFADQQYAETD